MPVIQSCCCWRSLRHGCYASAIYTMVYFSVTIITMAHFIDMEQRYLNGDMTEPESESFLEPDKITPITVSLNITLLACSTIGLVACLLLIFGVFKDFKYMLLPWLIAMALETLVEVVNLFYLFYLQTLNFNPITSFLFTLDFFIIILNVYAMVCVISQFQEYVVGRGTAAFQNVDRNTVQYTATAQQTTTTSSAPSGRRRSAARPMPSRCDPEELSEAPTRVISFRNPDVAGPSAKSGDSEIQTARDIEDVTSGSRAPDSRVHSGREGRRTSANEAQCSSTQPRQYERSRKASYEEVNPAEYKAKQPTSTCFKAILCCCICAKGCDEEDDPCPPRKKVARGKPWAGPRSEEVGIPPAHRNNRKDRKDPEPNTVVTQAEITVMPGRRINPRPDKTVTSRAHVSRTKSDLELAAGIELSPIGRVEVRRNIQDEELREAKELPPIGRVRATRNEQDDDMPAVIELSPIGRVEIRRNVQAPDIEEVKASDSRAQDRWAQPGRGIQVIKESCSQTEDDDFQVLQAASVLSRPSRSAIKKHVQFPDEQSCIDEAIEAPSLPGTAENPETRVFSSLWMELESEAPVPER